MDDSSSSGLGFQENCATQTSYRWDPVTRSFVAVDASAEGRERHLQSPALEASEAAASSSYIWDAASSSFVAAQRADQQATVISNHVVGPEAAMNPERAFYSDPTKLEEQKQDNSTEGLSLEALQARNRAMKVLLRIQQQAVDTSRALSPLGSANSAMSATPLEFRLRREAFLQKFEHKLHAAMLRNWEYLSSWQEKKLKQQLDQVASSKRAANDFELMRKAFMHERAQRLQGSMSQSKSGIGSKSQKRQRSREIVSTTSVYISGIPTDGSVTLELLESLFGSFDAKLVRIHQYRNKETGAPKEDALAIYGTAENDSQDLVDAICSQMNGVELPDGSILRVEPSISSRNKKPKANWTPASEIAGASNESVPSISPLPLQEKSPDMPSAGTPSQDDDADGDLDDFFSSLE